MPNKSKIIAKVNIPTEFFFSFLLGTFDGDGSSYSYFDPRFKSSFMFYTGFVSASKTHILWLQAEVFSRLAIKGHITSNKEKTYFQLKYAKADSLILLRKMYHQPGVRYLSRKHLKIIEMLRIIGQPSLEAIATIDKMPRWRNW